MASSCAPTWTGANTWNRTWDRTVSCAGAGTRTGAREWAGAGADAVPRAQQGAVVAVIELWAGNRALARAVFLIAVPAS